MVTRDRFKVGAAAGVLVRGARLPSRQGRDGCGLSSNKTPKRHIVMPDARCISGSLPDAKFDAKWPMTA